VYIRVSIHAHLPTPLKRIKSKINIKQLKNVLCVYRNDIFHNHHMDLLSVGFVNTLEATLYNTSLIPMTFSLRDPGDGTGENISKMAHYDSTIVETNITVPPKEFEIIPSSGVLEPKSSTKVAVAFCSNTVRKYDLSLVVDVAGVGSEVLSLPISARYALSIYLRYSMST